MKPSQVIYAIVCLLILLGSESGLPAQTVGASENRSCHSLVLQAAKELTFKQRSCYAVKTLVTPEFFVTGAAFAAFGAYRGWPENRRQYHGEYFDRLESYYARHASRATAEYLVAYLHKEDPRPHSSGRNGFWPRTGSALFSVMNSPNESGVSRPALAPLAGSFSAAFVGMALSRRNESLPDTLLHAGGIYSFYLVRAVCNEFKPELVRMAHKMLPVK